MNFEQIYRPQGDGHRCSRGEASVSGSPHLSRRRREGVPVQLTGALTRRSAELRNVDIHILTLAEAPYPALNSGGLCAPMPTSSSVAACARSMKGRADFTGFLVGLVFHRGWHAAAGCHRWFPSPPDEHGFCSFGVEVRHDQTSSQSSPRPSSPGKTARCTPHAGRQFHPSGRLARSSS